MTSTIAIWQTLTHLDRLTHICASRLNHNWFRWWFFAYSAPFHYLNQCWHLVNWILRKEFRCNSKKIQHLHSEKSWECHLQNGGIFSCGLNVLMISRSMFTARISPIIVSWPWAKTQTNWLLELAWLSTTQLGCFNHYLNQWPPKSSIPFVVTRRQAISCGNVVSLLWGTNLSELWNITEILSFKRLHLKTQAMLFSTQRVKGSGIYGNIHGQGTQQHFGKPYVSPLRRTLHLLICVSFPFGLTLPDFVSHRMLLTSRQRAFTTGTGITQLTS